MTNKKIIKKIVILICILIFISIIITTIFLLNKDKINKKINNEIGDAGEEIDYDTDKSTYVEDQETFFTVESCVNQYLNILNFTEIIKYKILLLFKSKSQLTNICIFYTIFRPLSRKIFVQM